LLAGAVACLAILQTTAAAAQVGHLPESSPYRDMRVKQALVFFGGYLTGGEGSAGVGPTDGPLAGARWEITVGAPSILFLGVSAANLDRLLINPDNPPSTRTLGTAKQTIVMLDGGLNFVLTGRKTWKGFAPYVGVGMGMAFGGSVPEDSSGFTFKSKFHIGPALGVRIHPNPRFHFRVEWRGIFWRLTYPQQFFQPPTSAPGTPVLNPLIETDSDWVFHPTLVLGIAYTLRR
jgi:opacity protein-like surface antigen